MLEQLKEEARKEFEEKIEKEYYGACFECCDYEKMIYNIQEFIDSIITQAFEVDNFIDSLITKAYEEGKKEIYREIGDIYVKYDCNCGEDLYQSARFENGEQSEMLQKIGE